MKKTKNVIAVTLLAVVVQLFLCSNFGAIKEVKAAGLVQSEGILSTQLKHVHSETECKEQVLIPCGGSWCSNYDPVKGYTVFYCSNYKSTKVVDGVLLSSIHDAPSQRAHSGMHAGEYIERSTCNLDEEIGEFKVEKTKSGNRVSLKASFDDPKNVISEYRFEWNQGDATDGERESTISIDHNGQYKVTLEWFDSQAKVWYSNTITYDDTSFPIEMRFFDNENVLIESKLVNYGEQLPTVSAKLKEGYIFGGYTYNGQTLYDENFRAIEGIKAEWELKTVEIKANYIPKEYDLYYGTDDNGDGIPDSTVHVVFGSAYGPITLKDGDPGKKYGYSLNGIPVFDNEGNPVSDKWKWDGDNTITLNAMKKPYNPKAGAQGGNGNENDDLQENTISPDSLEDIDVLLKDSVSDNSVSDNSVSENTAAENDLDMLQNREWEDETSNADDRNNETDENHFSNNIDNIYRHSSRHVDTELNQDIISTNITDEIWDNADELETVENENDYILAGAEEEKYKQLENEEMKEKRAKTIKIVTAVSVGTVGGGFAIYGLVWYLMMIYSSAQIWTYSKNNKRISLGKIIVFRGAVTLKCRVNQKLLDKSETGRFELVFSGGFLSKHAKKAITITIGAGENFVSDVIKPVIYFTSK